MPSRSLPGLQQGNAPWPAERRQLGARLAAIGLPALPEEGSALHTHQHLDIFINGASVPIPSEIGIDPEERFIAPLHTHDATGIIHVESPTIQTYTLGQFFDVWGVRFTATCIGGYCAHDAVALRVFVNGQLVTHDPRQVALSPRQEIVVTYGPAAASPPLPSRYEFPPGL
jgi:hypothetical protein